MNILDGGWAQPKPEDYIVVELKVSESLARDAGDSGALERLLGQDAIRAVKRCLEEKDLRLAEESLQATDKRLEEIETVERRRAELLEAERLHREGNGFGQLPQEPQDG